MRTNLGALLVAFAAACGSVATTPDAGDDDDDGGGGDAVEADAAPTTFSVGGTVSGFAGSGLVLQLNGGGDLEIDADGAFMFTAELADDATYEVTVLSQPSCPIRVCTLTNESGTIAGADVTDVTLACAEDEYRMVSYNWGDNSLRITDDVLAIASGGTATPRVVVGASTLLGYGRLDSVAHDPGRDLIYATRGDRDAILVFPNASTVTGDVAPARQISVAGELNLQGVEIDADNDRLYAVGPSALYIFNGAHALNGAVVPTATIALTSVGVVTLDRRADRLYVGGDFSMRLYIFDAASTLTSASTPTGSVTWTNFNGPPVVAIDSCRDRLYLGSNQASTAGYNVYAFDNASTLDGAIDVDTVAAARAGVGECIAGVLDGGGRLHCFSDSATQVRIYNAPETWTGTSSPAADKTINAVVSSGYGMTVTPL